MKKILISSLLAISASISGYAQENNPYFYPEISYPVTYKNDYANVNSIAIDGDYNGDGKKDLIIIGLYSSHILYGNGQGLFTAPQLLNGSLQSYTGTSSNPVPPVTTNTDESFIRDVTGDGINDSIVRNFYAGVSLFKGKPNGTYNAEIIINTSLNYSIHFADLNNDGYDDIVVLGAGTESPWNRKHNVSILLNKRKPISYTIDRLILVDADSKTYLDTLSSRGAKVVNLYTERAAHYTIVAQPATAVGSVVWYLDGKIFRTTNGTPPYSLTGVSVPGTNNYNSWWVPPLGKHTIIAVPYSLPNGQGTPGLPRSITLNTYDSFKSKFSQFTLINADTKQPIAELKDGDTLTLSKLSATHFTIVADAYYNFGYASYNGPHTVWSTKWEYDGKPFRIGQEKIPPYSFTGVSVQGTNYYNSWWAPAPGKHTIKATPYFTSNAAAFPNDPLSVTFYVKATPASRVSGDDELSSSEIKAYPNPMQESLNVQLSNDKEEVYTLRLLDVMGKTVYTKAQQGGSEASIDIASLNLESGVYFLHVESKFNQAKKSFMLNKL